MLKKSFALIFFILFSGSSLLAAENSVPKAKDGVIELSTVNLENNFLQLDGDWEFFWDTLLTPEGIASLPKEYEKTFIMVPKAWSSKKAGGFPVEGRATYRLNIKSPEADGLYGIRLHDLFTASKVWFDGKLIYTTGKTGYNKETSIPGFSYEDIPLFFKGQDEHELVVQISNYNHTRSGLVKPVKFGTFNSLTRQSKNWMILNLIIIGIILVIGFNHLVNYFLHKNDITNLFFGLLCIVMIMRNLSTGQRIISFVFEDINWQLLFKMDNFSGFGTIPLFAIFMYISFKKDFPKLILKAILAIGLLITLFVAVTPQLIYGKFRMLYELYVLFGGLFITFYVLLRATFKKRNGALLTFIGFFILYATAINDVLISMGLVSGVEVAPFGLVSYMLIQSYVLTRGAARAIAINEKLSKALKDEKQLLEKNVKERTRELELRNEEIIQKQNELHSESWENESLASINTILNKYNTKDINILSQHLISEIMNFTDSQIGVIYISNNDKNNPMLELTGSKNASSEILSQPKIAPGEGILGACFLDMKVKEFENVKNSYVKYYSGLGEVYLSNLILIPLHSNNEPIGVIELASIKKLTNKHFKLLEKITGNISSTLRFIQMNNRNLELIAEYKSNTSELNMSQSEIENQLEEIQMLREELDMLRKSN